MAITREYFYTLETYLVWESIFNDQELDTAASVEGDNQELIPNYLKVHAETTSTAKVSQWIIQKGYQIHYRLRFYKKVTGGTTSQNGLYQLKDNVVKNISVTMPSEYASKVKKSGINTRHNYKPRTSLENVKNNDGDVFWFTAEPTADAFTITKAFTVDADMDDPDNVDSLSATFKGFFPPFRVSAARNTPKIPDKFYDALRKTGNYSNNKNLSVPQNSPYVYDYCTQTWVGLNISSQRAKSSTDKTLVQDYAVVTSDLKGAKITISPKKTDPLIASASGVLEEGKQISYERKKLANLLIGNCTDPTRNGGNNGDNIADAPPTPPTNDLRWNPPTHISSRNLPYGMLMDALVPSGNNAVPVPVSKREVAYQQAQYGKLDLHMGKIFQDSAGAKVLNTNPDKLTLPEGKTWGFKFMYNPTTFSYSTSANNSVDWGIGSKDPAILLSGNQQVTFEIYINRIADMGYLTALKAGHDVPPTGKSYQGRALEPYEIDGLLARGTEYDIEFLYRVLNGDPLKNPLLFDNESYSGITSDFGYTTAVPCWLHLNKNLRYYGSVASFTVNHAMFTVNMVPMLSTVNITFSRYPALWGSKNEAWIESGAKNSSQFKTFVVGVNNSASTPPATGNG